MHTQMSELPKITMFEPSNIRVAKPLRLGSKGIKPLLHERINYTANLKGCKDIFMGQIFRLEGKAGIPNGRTDIFVCSPLHITFYPYFPRRKGNKSLNNIRKEKDKRGDLF
jgi:hypothetical protein